MKTPALSVVVIAYDMARELPRTLLSLSPRMQRGIAADDYEIIVVDNGSRRPADPEACLATGAPVHVERLDGAGPSPVRAINLGLSRARAPLRCVMIDGARLASPGLLAHALLAARLHPRPVIHTLAFHLGPDVQMRSVLAGYDQKAEDALLEGADWTADGYRLFGISVFAGSSSAGWFGVLHETNALFLPASLWDELGGFDERFVAPGGGLANLDAYARASALPGTLPIRLLGEATFHQVHGGVATNAPCSPWDAFHAEYRAIRGHDWAPPTRAPVFVGTAPPAVLPSLAASARLT